MMLLLKICLSFFLLFSFQSQSSLFSLSPFSFFQKSNDKKRKHPLETNSPLSVPNKEKQSRTNTSDPSLNESLNQDMEDDFIPDEIINSQKKKISIECHICNKKIRTYDSLINHFNNKHPGQNPYKCDHCDYEFKTFYTFYIHKIKIHSFKKDKHTFICPTCNTLFFFKSTLKNHEKMHSRIKPFKCDICQKSYRLNGDLISHKKTLHTNTPSPCCFCPESFNSLYEIREHRKKIHPNKETICKLCGMLFKKGYTATEHEKSCRIKQHLENNPLQCFFCKKSFNNSDEISEHYKATYPKNKRICVHCGMLFGYNHTARRHEKRCPSNENDKSETFIKCTHCEKSFNDEPTLRRHEKPCKIKKHIEQNALQCFFCKKSFNTFHKIREHYKDMYPNKEIVCEHCGTLSNSKEATKRHKERCQSKKNYKLEIGNNNPLDPTNITEDSPPHTENLNQEIFDWKTYFQENDPTRNNPPPHTENLNQEIFDWNTYFQENDPTKNNPPPYDTAFNQNFPPSLYTQSQEEAEAICAEIRNTLFPPSGEEYDLPNALELDNFLNGIAQDSRLKSQA